MGLVIIIFGALSIPLGIALRDIAYQTYVVKVAKSTIEEYFGVEGSHLSIFKVNFSKSKEIAFDAVVLTPDYKSNAIQELKAILTREIERTITLSLDQIVMAHEHTEAAEKLFTENTITPAKQSQQLRQPYNEEILTQLK